MRAVVIAPNSPPEEEKTKQNSRDERVWNRSLIQGSPCWVCRFQECVGDGGNKPREKGRQTIRGLDGQAEREREREKNRPHGHTPPTRLRPLSGEAPKKKAKREREGKKRKRRRRRKNMASSRIYTLDKKMLAGRLQGRGFFSLRCGGVGW